MAFNKVILIGNITEDIELKQTPSGVPVANFRIAVGRRFKKEGEQDADFIGIVCWRATAEFVAKYFAKGRAILVCGQLKSRNWTDNDGNKRYALDVEADEVSFVDKKPTETQGQDAPTQTTPPPYASNAELVEYSDESDLPF